MVLYFSFNYVPVLLVIIYAKKYIETRLSYIEYKLQCFRICIFIFNAIIIITETLWGKISRGGKQIC